MTVKELRILLSNYKDNMPVYIGYDGCYGSTVKLLYIDTDVFDKEERLYITEDNYKPSDKHKGV